MISETQVVLAVRQPSNTEPLHSSIQRFLRLSVVGDSFDCQIKIAVINTFALAGFRKTENGSAIDHQQCRNSIAVMTIVAGLK